MDEERSSIDRMLNVSTPYAPASDEEAQARLTTTAEGRSAESDGMVEEDVLDSVPLSDAVGTPPAEVTADDSTIVPYAPPPIPRDTHVGSPQQVEYPGPSSGEGNEDDGGPPPWTEIGKAQLKAFAELVRTARFEVESPDRHVRVVAGGNGTIIEIQIDPGTVKRIRGEELGRAVLFAVTDAQTRARRFRESERAKLASDNESS